MDLELIYHWFYNLLNNKINEEILYLKLNNHLGLKYINYTNKIIKNISSLGVENLKLIDLHTVEDKSISLIIEKYNIKNTNIVIIDTTNIKIQLLLKNLKHNILYPLNELNRKKIVDKLLSFDEFIKESKKQYLKPDIDTIYSYVYYYKQRDPIEIIKQINYSNVKNYVFSFKSKFLPNNCYYDKFNITLDCKTILTNDIYYLLEKHILTSRLGILIYRIGTLEFDTSTTKIGKYYRQKLGIKSKTVRPAKRYNTYNIPNLTLKAYDLESNKALDYLTKHLANINFQKKLEYDKKIKVIGIHNTTF